MFMAIWQGMLIFDRGLSILKVNLLWTSIQFTMSSRLNEATGKYRLTGQLA